MKIQKMETLSKKHIHEKPQRLRPRVTIDCSKPKITDQSHKSMCDINAIMESYRKTGMLPQMRHKQPFFMDVSNVPSIENAYDLVQQAKENFMALPSDIRKLMDNDPRKLETFVKNPENHDTLRKYGLMSPLPDPTPEPDPKPTKTSKEPDTGD